MSKTSEPTTSSLLTYSAAGSPAKTCPSPTRKDKDWKVSEADCGLSLNESPTNSDPNGSSSKTSSTHGSGGCPSCGADSTPSGMPACHFDCQPLTWERGIEGDEFSYLPTPTASSYGSCRGGGQGRTGKWRKSLSGRFGGPHAPNHREWMMGFPIGWTEIDVSETR